MQAYLNMVCEICGEENPNNHQDFCKRLNCSGRMIEQHKKERTMKIEFKQSPVLLTIEVEALAALIYAAGKVSEEGFVETGVATSADYNLFYKTYSELRVFLKANGKELI